MEKKKESDLVFCKAEQHVEHRLSEIRANEFCREMLTPM